MQIIKGKIPGAKKIVVYGSEGIGKSTFASGFPRPVFIDTEGSTKDMDVARTPAPSSWAMLMDQVRYFISHPEELQTLVIDTADWAEQLCANEVCSRYQKAGIEDFGYGKGYTYLQEEFGRLLNLLTELVEQKGVNVVLTAHAKMRKFEQPDELGAYDRWEMKLTKQVAPMVKEWADMVLFANYKTIVVNVDGQGAQKGKNKAQGGKRVMYTTHHNCWDAKNRYGLPEELPFDYSEIASVIETPPAMEPPVSPQVKTEHSLKPATQKAEQREAEAAPLAESMGMETAEWSREEKVQDNAPMPPPARQPSAEGKKERTWEPQLSRTIPKALKDLMDEKDVCEWDIQDVVTARGYYPQGTLIENYDPGFIDGVLVAAWPQVLDMIRTMRKDEKLPFN